MKICHKGRGVFMEYMVINKIINIDLKITLKVRNLLMIQNGQNNGRRISNPFN